MGKFIEDQRKKHDAGLCEMMLNVQKNAQRTKLESARERGRMGWETCPPEKLLEMLESARYQQDWVSVANYAGMLYCHTLADTTDVLAGPRHLPSHETQPGKRAGSPPRTTGRPY